MDAGLGEANVADVASLDAGVDASSDAAVDAGVDAAASVEAGEPSARAIAGGRRLYNEVCMLCHDIRHRLPGLGWNPGRMTRRIRRGGKRMPAITRQELSAGQMRMLFAYLKEIGALRQPN